MKKEVKFTKYVLWELRLESLAAKCNKLYQDYEVVIVTFPDKSE